MSRSSWKPKHISNFLLKEKIQGQDKYNIWSRSSTIPESLRGKIVLVHTGKDFKKVYIKRSRVGFKFGEFALTKKFTQKKAKKDLKKKKNNIWDKKQIL